ncbi:hypothetical protein N867_18385 [Actinotalea fermentans ATCC 43279 = JCM 9966 = DSM 3133]|nr:hypothetical protein N867_18385 [Actinotalea fermentans ATCC 43279 = JCM 9966 = DSM 3133]
MNRPSGSPSENWSITRAAAWADRRTSSRAAARICWAASAKSAPRPSPTMLGVGGGHPPRLDGMAGPRISTAPSALACSHRRTATDARSRAHRIVSTCPARTVATTRYRSLLTVSASTRAARCSFAATAVSPSHDDTYPRARSSAASARSSARAVRSSMSARRPDNDPGTSTTGSEVYPSSG